MELIGAVFALLTVVLVWYALNQLAKIREEAHQQNEILYQIALTLKADVPESLRPRGGFFAELRRGLKPRAPRGPRGSST